VQPTRARRDSATFPEDRGLSPEPWLGLLTLAAAFLAQPGQVDASVQLAQR
jgi:hypothetical protein